MTEPLSLAAQAIVNAAVEAGGGYGRATPVLYARLAAALRAAAAQTLAYEIHCPGEGWYELVLDAKDVYAIAAELEGADAS
jgi:hypothetical protein